MKKITVVTEVNGEITTTIANDCNGITMSDGFLWFHGLTTDEPYYGEHHNFNLTVVTLIKIDILTPG